MFCTKCGNKLPDDAKFCSKCGSAVAEKEEEKNEAVIAEQMSEPSAEEIKTALEKKEATTVSLTDDDDTPAVTIAEMEAEKAEQTAVAVAEKPEEAEEKNETAEEKPAEAPAAANIPESAYYDFPEETEVPKKSYKKLKTGLIAGTTAAAVLAGGAAVCYGFFSNECMLLFMGKEGFAELVEENSAEYLSGGEIKTKEMDRLLAEYAEQMFYGEEAEETALTKAMLDEALELYGDSSIKFSAEIDPGMLLALADTEGMLDEYALDAVIEAAKGDDCDRLSLILNDEGARFIGADFYIQDDKMAILLPELTSKTFCSDITEENMSEDTERVEFSVEEMTRIRERLCDIYMNGIKSAEIEHIKEDTEVVLAGQPVENERVIIKLSAENVNAMLTETADFLKNDEYLRTYYVEATENEVSEYEKLFEEEELNSETSIVIENYITDRAEVTGKKISLTETDKETGDVFTAGFETTMGNCDIHMGDDELAFDFTQRKTDEESGIMELTVTGEEVSAPLVLEMLYSGVGTAEYCGKPVNTGKYTVKVSEKDKFFDSIIKGVSEVRDNDVSDTDMKLSSDFGADMGISAVMGMFKDITVESSVECDGSSIVSSMKLEIPLLFDLSFSAEASPLTTEKPVMPDCTDALDINADDIDEETENELTKEVMENVLELAKENKYMEILAESLEAEEYLEEILREESFTKNYSAYSDKTRLNADDIAEDMLFAFKFALECGIEEAEFNQKYIDYIKEYTSGREMTVKVYFDENGEIDVLDDGGHYFIDYDKFVEYLSIEELPKNVYAEFVAGGLFSDGGATVIYTDNPHNIPETLPDSCNYFDGVFSYDGDDENLTEGFIIGTSPNLGLGVSDAAAVFGDVMVDKAVLDGYAKDMYRHAEKFFSENPGVIRGSGSVAVTNVEGSWSVEECYAGEILLTPEELFTRDITEEFASYLNENAVSSQWFRTEIHFGYEEDGSVSVIGAGAMYGTNNSDFRIAGLPDTYCFEEGYCYSWNSGSVTLPEINGVCFDLIGEPYAFGSYCRATDAPLGGIAEFMESLIQTPAYGEMDESDDGGFAAGTQIG